VTTVHAAGAADRVTLLCAASERALAQADAVLLEALGLRVRLAGLDGPAPAQGVQVVYLPTGEADIPNAVRPSDSGAGEGAARIAVVADPVGRVLESSRRGPFRRVLVRSPEPAAAGAFAAELREAVLEELDRCGAGGLAGGAEETRFLPGSLAVSWSGGRVVVPVDFGGLVTVGRSPTCQVTIESSFASRLHGCIRSAAGVWLYRDMSRNGTVLYDGHEELLIQDAECELADGVELRIGDQSLRVARNPE
jgi:hypothetical protein